MTNRLNFDRNNSGVIEISSDDAEETQMNVRSSSSVTIGYFILFTVRDISCWLSWSKHNTKDPSDLKQQTIRTRSSSGMYVIWQFIFLISFSARVTQYIIDSSKKRIMDDAATFSDSDEFSWVYSFSLWFDVLTVVTSKPVESPKRLRRNISKVVLEDPDHDRKDDFHIVKVERLSEEIERLSFFLLLHL